jgi:hypothetical protein
MFAHPGDHKFYAVSLIEKSYMLETLGTIIGCANLQSSVYYYFMR